MQEIGLRELRQHASRYVDAARQGHGFVVTVRGRPVARLVGQAQDAVEGLIADGRVRQALRGIDDLEPVWLGAEAPTASDVLTEMRADER